MNPASFEPAFGQQSSITEFSLHSTTVREELVFDYNLSKVVGLTFVWLDLKWISILYFRPFVIMRQMLLSQITWILHHRTLIIDVFRGTLFYNLFYLYMYSRCAKLLAKLVCSIARVSGLLRQIWAYTLTSACAWWVPRRTSCIFGVWSLPFISGNYS